MRSTLEQEVRDRRGGNPECEFLADGPVCIGHGSWLLAS